MLLIGVATGKEADVWISCEVKPLESCSHSDLFTNGDRLWELLSSRVWPCSSKTNLALCDRAFNPGFGLLTLCVSSLIGRTYSAGIVGSRECSRPFKCYFSVFYLRDLHSIGKELNFSFSTYHRSNFIFLGFRGVTWQVMRNEFSGWVARCWRCSIIFFKLVLYGHEMCYYN